MLRQRIITALILLAFLLPALLVSAAWPFSVITLLLVGAAGWEWARLNGAGQSGALALGGLLIGSGLLALAMGWVGIAAMKAWWIVVLAWVIGGGWALGVGPAGWAGVSQAARIAVGGALLWAAWLAITLAKVQGLGFILSVFCLVWAADIAAYFGGRAFGRRKLAPSISPGKSWEGAWCGAAAAALLAVVWMVVDHRVREVGGSLFESLFIGFGGVGMVLAVVGLSALSVVGDLFESLVKRAAGAKDSSGLLPGHGGVLDRIDALLPVLPAALALHSLT
jgi:phosphatidate cytidylyltransferase